MRIAIVEPDGAGGLLHYAYQLAAALQQEGAEVTLVTSHHFELDHLDPPFRVEKLMRLWPSVEPERRGWLRRRIRRTVRAVRYTREWARLVRYLIAVRPDIVQFSTIRFSYLALFLRRLQRKGMTLAQICHEFELREAGPVWIRRLHVRLARSVYRCFDAIFFHGAGHRDRFLRLFGEPPGTVELIPHGNESLLADGGSGDLRRHYGLDPDQPTALFFGDIRPSKGVPTLIEAFADARAELDAALVVAGRPREGMDVAGLRRLAADLGVSDSVVVDPRYVPLREVGPLMRTGDVVVLPYRSGTASGVLQTAYTFARPVIVSDVGALAEAVDEGVTGLVVPPGDRPALARSLVKLLGDRAEARAMGEAGRRAAEERFAWSPIGSTVMAVYRRLP